MNKLVDILLLSSLMMACSEPSSVEVIQEEKPLFYVPDNFPEPEYDIESKPVTEAGFELGRKLFYDGRLSRDGTISCAECHSQSYAFTHHGHIISHGIDDKMGSRNAPAVQNTAFMNSFFWDGGVFDLDFFSVAPITNPVEMDEEVGNILEKLKKDNEYPGLFKKAFGTEEITSTNFLLALSQFMNGLISADSKYDKYVRNEAGGSFSTDELEGLKIFENKCSSCHGGALFSSGGFRNNGLEPYRRDPDLGRFIITENPQDSLKFKVPSLRNIGYTAPYMHDGRFSTLDEVLEHYNSGVVMTSTLDPLLQQNGQLGIPLSTEEKEKLKVFLKTLNDEEFIKNARFAAP
ncbi:MAG: cytochrome-c peroxidase [Cytophagales bacterium]|nr:cytochrome-c peroxidase [Cytophagales bacterium]